MSDCTKSLHPERQKQSASEALDHELITACLGTLDSYGCPAAALHDLLCWQQGVAEYFAKDRIAELEAENARLLKVITDHNDDCLQICEWKADRGDCNAYRRRGRSCPDCPRHNRIAIPVADALLSTGGEG